MAQFNNGCRCSWNTAAVVASAIIGVVTAFLQITGIVTATPVFLWVTFGVAVAYLAVFVLAAALASGAQTCECLCAVLNALLAGVLGNVLLAVVLLAVGIVATSVISALLVGLLLFFFALMLISSANFIRCLFGCEN